jgi:hypothetical protein
MKNAGLFATSLVFLLLLPLFAAAQAAPAGEWQVALNTPMGARNFKVVLKQDGDKLSCVLKRDAGEIPCDVNINGKQIKIVYKVTLQDNEMAITLTGSFEGGALKGDADFGGLAQGDWSAKRAEAGVAAATQAAISPARSASGIEGDWDFVIHSPQGTHNVRASFARDGDKLKGFFTGPSGQLPLAGTMQGSDLKFSFTYKYEGNDFLITMGGKLDGDAIKGDADFGGMAQGDWSAKRAIAGSVAPAVAAQPQESKVDVTGTWLFQVETSMGSGTPTFTFKQEGEKLTGHYKGLLGEADLSGTVKGNVITFSFNFDAQGMQGTVTYTGTIDRDTMKGTAKLADAAEGTFTAKRQ